MSLRSNFTGRWSLPLCLVVLGLITFVLLLPYGLEIRVAGENRDGLMSTDQGHELPDYDIRSDRSAFEAKAQFRASANRSAVELADIRDSFVRGEESLRSEVPNLGVSYHNLLGNPEVIEPDVMKGGGVFRSAGDGSRADKLRDFAVRNGEMIGLTASQIGDLTVTADYKNPQGALSFARLEQSIHGIPVFRGEIRAGFNYQGEMFRVVNDLATGLDYDTLSTDFGDPARAVELAAHYLDREPGTRKLNQNESTELRAVFGTGDWATTAEKMYFPIEPGVARAAWRVLNWGPGDAYYVVVDAETGAMLLREDITFSQTQTATYNVYANTNSILRTMTSPAPLSPNPIDPGLGTQGTLLSRTNVTTIGNEGVYSFNNLGWITDNTNGVNGITDGNNVEAGVDRVTPNGVDAPVQGTNRVFNFSYTPGAGPSGGPGDDPRIPVYQNGASTNLFYVTNRYHDETYLLGFTEQARNFQHDNFGRGGAGNDRVSAEAQDDTVGGSCSAQPCVNNANFSTPADGGRGRMQMYLWNRMTPWRDGDLDAEIIVHELTHGLFGRLHNGTGGTQAGQMNEGNSDFFAHVLLALDTDPINGVYVTGGYTTLNLRTVFSGTANYYYGIRRFPKAVIAFTGGPNNRPHNPLTYADIDPVQMNLTNGAYSPAFTGSATAVHDGGEIWSSMLWEVRAKLVQRLGAVPGNKKVLQLVMDGMKVSPANPTMMQERNAILSAAIANGNGGDVGDVWAGFALRGLGFSAQNPTGNTVVEAFDLPNLVQTAAFTVSDAPGDNDGYPEPGEPISLTVPLTNNTGGSATGVTVQLVGGGSANYGTIANGATASQAISYTVPGGTPCGSALTLTFNVNSSLGAASFQRTIIIGVPNTTFTENFDGVAAPTFPAGWTATAIQSGVNFVTTTTNPDTAPNSAFALDPTTVGGGTDLTSPSIPISAPAATVSFRNRYNTEPGWDGGVLEISVNGGGFQDIITAGGRFIENGYNGSLGNGVNNPLANRSAWTGDSSGYVTTVVQLPASAAGQNVQLKWRFGADDNTAATGWNVDTVSVNGSYNCSFVATSVRSPYDFDGDGKTDVSIYRPGVGEWWLLRSSDMTSNAFQFGVATDKIAPGDYTGDGKADVAFWRPTTGEWFILRSENGSYYSFPFGTTGDIPASGDYDGDGKTDVAVFRPSNSTWFILRSSDLGVTITTFGTTGDKPVAADYDGDGKTDVAIYRPSVGEWWYLRSIDGGNRAFQFGTSTDKPVQGDFTGDGKADVAFWRPSTGEWFILRSENGSYYSFPFGLNGDVPAPGDYDGDGKIDATVFRPSTNVWYSNRSTAGFLFVTWGSTGDQPVPNAFVP